MLCYFVRLSTGISVFNFLYIAYLRVYPRKRNILVLFPLPVVPMTNKTYLLLIKARASFVLFINLYNYKTSMVIILDFRAQRYSYNNLFPSSNDMLLNILAISPGRVPYSLLKIFSKWSMLLEAYMSSGIIWQAREYSWSSYFFTYEINNSLCTSSSNEP